MNVSPRRPLFTRRPESNLYRMFFWLILALGGVWVILQFRAGEIKSPFQAPPAPTRTSASYALEGDAQFTAGDINAAISAYQAANGLVNLVTPTSAVVMGGLAIARVGYGVWWRFVWPVLLLLVALSILVLAVGTLV